MKVFISHSWKNKLSAQKIADALHEMGIVVWLDAQDLLPGEVIQSVIDSELAQTDVMLLLWSSESAKSSGVAAEIATALRIGTRIIPCCLDTTALRERAELASLKGIKFVDFDEGLGRLRMVLFSYMTRAFGAEKIESADSLNKLIGALETVNHLYVAKPGDTERSAAADDYWIEKIKKAEADAQRILVLEQQKIASLEYFLKLQMQALSDGLNDPVRVQAIYDLVKNHPLADDPIVTNFLGPLENILKSFTRHHQQSPAKKFGMQLAAAQERFKQQLKDHLGWVGGFIYEQALGQVTYFFDQAVERLERLDHIAQGDDIPLVVKEVCDELFRYVQTPGGFIQNDEGLIGFTDDALFVHCAVESLLAKGFLPAAAWEVDRSTLDAATRILFAFIDNAVVNHMQQSMVSYLQSVFEMHNPPANSSASHQQQEMALEKLRQEVWAGKLMGLQTSMIHIPR